MRPPNDPPAAWPALLADAVATPGVVSAAYRRFWNYSAGNQLLALFQCHGRGLDPGPIHTFRGWADLGRHVRKGEKALVLCMPVTVKGKKKADPPPELEPDAADDGTYTRFVYRPHWFVLSQTKGEPYVPQELPDWSESTALAALSVTRVPFIHPDGNAQGYAAGRTVSVSPVAFAPHRTLFHELAHVLLGHTGDEGRMDDGEHTPKNLREVEAEAVALICCESLGLPGAEFCRGYLQHWLQGEVIPERSAHRIFKAADGVLRAGRPKAGAAPAAPEGIP